MTTETPDDSGRVVMHVPTGDGFDTVVRNLGNLLAALGERDGQVEVVCHGPGLNLLLATDSHRPEVEDLSARGVVFDACANTMTRMGATRDQLTPGTRVVESGLAHVIRLQWAGAAYVRP